MQPIEPVSRVFQDIGENNRDVGNKKRDPLSMQVAYSETYATLNGTYVAKNET